MQGLWQCHHLFKCARFYGTPGAHGRLHPGLGSCALPGAKNDLSSVKNDIWTSLPCECAAFSSIYNSGGQPMCFVLFVRTLHAGRSFVE